MKKSRREQIFDARRYEQQRLAELDAEERGISGRIASGEIGGFASLAEERRIAFERAEIRRKTREFCDLNTSLSVPARGIMQA
jgi:hypothetical protein